MSQPRGTPQQRDITESTVLALLLVALFGVIYALLARYALAAFPFSGDEYSLSLQGQLFAHGQLKAPAPDHIEWLRIDHVVIDQWVRSKYPPGAPALLSLGYRQGYPWLVTPLEAVGTLLLVWHTIRRLLGGRPALIGLVALGLAPLFMFDAASFYAHAPTMLFLAIAFAAVASWSIDPHRPPAVLTAGSESRPSIDPHRPPAVLTAGSESRPSIDPHRPPAVLTAGSESRPSIDPHRPPAVLTAGSESRPSIDPHRPPAVLTAGSESRPSIDPQRRRDPWLALVGLAIGCAFLIRPVDALLFGVAMLAFRSPRAVIIPALTALPFVAVNLWYQKQLFGGWLVDGYHAYEPTFTALYGADTAGNPLSIWNLLSATQQWNHVDIFRSLVSEWTIPGAVIVAMFGAFAVDRRDPARPMRTFSVVLIAVYVIGLLPMIADPDDGPHPRYLSVTLIPLAFLAAAGYAKTTEALAVRFGKRIRTVVVIAAIVFALAQMGSFLQDRIPKIWKRQGLYDAVAAQHVHPGAIVVVRAQFPSRFARNGPFFDGVLYLSAPPDTGLGVIGTAYPDREIWEAREGLPWTLVRVK